MTIKNFKFAFIFILLCSFVSCNNNKEEVISESASTDTDISSDEDILSEDQEQNSDYQFIPPSPIQIGLILEKAGMDYIPDIANPANNVEDYTDKFRQSICFGVYSCDLAYCVLNDKYDEASEYLKSIKSLGAKIGLETVFQSEDIVTRFEKNIGNKDSIVDILIYVQENTDAYIDDNGMDDLSVIYFSGAWIEGMYLGVKTLSKDSDKNVSVLLSEQMGILELLLAGIEHIAEKSEDIEELNSAVSELLEAYNNLESVQLSAEFKDNLDIDLTTEEIEIISGKIIDIRQSLVQ
ncbi:MAG: hypothetical protein CL853_06605 [Crocinitomicaceae bacterium]|nr:hypothetical protein [Crocinitomicaceae bacterium]|tara:strand:+ start:3258 stop:4139 length:882 start_codon:yes stop_codon:yes gene_type:complete